jgi:hypothetical protein
MIVCQLLMALLERRFDRELGVAPLQLKNYL